MRIPSVIELVNTKRDPGPLFPWDEIVPACGLQRLR
jgi:N-acetyl-anhydromuramyl-L-alanine amidase AmpD